MSVSIGHNSGEDAPFADEDYSLPSPDRVRAVLAREFASYAARRDELLAGAARFHEHFPSIPDKDERGRAADFALMIKRAAKSAEDARVVTKRPIDVLASTVQEFFKPIVDSLNQAAATIGLKLAVFDEAEEARRRAAARALAEQARKKAEEAAALAARALTDEAVENAIAAEQVAENAVSLANARPSELTRTRGELGSVSGLQKRLVPDLDNLNLPALVKAVADGKEPASYLQINLPVVRDAVRRGVSITGVPVIEEKKVFVRG